MRLLPQSRKRLKEEKSVRQQEAKVCAKHEESAKGLVLVGEASIGTKFDPL